MDRTGHPPSRESASPSPSLRPRLRRAALAACALAAAILLPGCPAKGGGGHDHEGHDHGHEGDSHEGEGEAAEAGHVDEVHLTEDAVRAAGIRVETAAARVLRPTFVVPARIALDTDAVAHVGVQFTGRTREVRVKRGDRVAKGDVMLVVESPEFGREQIDYLAARDALERAQAPVDLSRRLLDRARQAHEASRSLPLSTVEERERALQEAETAQASARAAVSAAENRLHLLGMLHPEVAALAASREIRTLIEVRAPIAGDVIEREVTQGEIVGPDRDALLVLADTTWIWALAEVPEARISEIRPGATARIACASCPPGAFEAKVGWIEPHVDASTRTAKVRLVLQREGTGLVPGMFAEAEFAAAGGDPAPVVVVPDAAVQNVEGGPAVFVPVKGEAHTFALRAVRVGKAVGGLVPILEGLAAGEEFVASGSFILKADLGKSSAAHEH